MIFRQFLFREKLPLMNKALNTYAQRQQVIAKNIANATTPGYKPQEVSFEEQFNEENMVLSGVRSNDNHIPIGNMELDEVEAEVQDQQISGPDVYFTGESHVNVDKEMTKLAENQIKFRLASTLTSKYFKTLGSSIKGTSSG